VFSVFSYRILKYSLVLKKIFISKRSGAAFSYFSCIMPCFYYFHNLNFNSSDQAILSIVGRLLFSVVRSMVVSPSARVRISSKESMVVVVVSIGCCLYWCVWVVVSISSLAKSIETDNSEEGRDQIRQNLITLV
jgi:hypothetical protein